MLVISDYGKGVVDAEFLSLLSKLREQHGFVYLIDPKRRNFAHYRGATLVKPNREEAGIAAGIEIRNERDLSQAGTHLLQFWQTEAVLVSRSEEGMSLFKHHTEHRNIFSPQPVKSMMSPEPEILCSPPVHWP